MKTDGQDEIGQSIDSNSSGYDDVQLLQQCRMGEMDKAGVGWSKI